jgi:hypothetical protein
MDVTTVNDRHLYRATVVVTDPFAPAAPAELADRIVRFGPAGWITVIDSSAADVVALYPVTQVRVVSGLREVGTTTPGGTPADE